MTIKIKTKDGFATASCKDDSDTKNEVFNMLVEYFLPNRFHGESIHQCDDAQIDGLDLLVKIADRLDINYKEDEEE